MSHLAITQRLKQTQNQTIAPQMRRSLEVLQLPMLELRDAVLQEIHTNPTLEEGPSNAELSLEGNKEQNETENTRESTEELNFEEGLGALKRMDQDFQEHFHQDTHFQTYTAEDAQRRQNFFESFVSETSLQEHIMEQMNLGDATHAQKEALPYIVGCLDDRGFLTMSLEEIANMANTSPEIIQSTLDILKTIEPIGLGSKDLQECLLCQLEYQGEEKSLAFKILKEEFGLLLRRKIQDLSKKLDVQIGRVQEAIEHIAQLDPAPGRRFSADNNRSILADIVVEKDPSGQWLVSLNSDYIPKLRINPTYKALLAKETLSTQEKDYLRIKIQSGNFLINAIEQRQHTLERIAQQIVYFQKDFFEQGIQKLHPLTMYTVADQLNVHETTVSRAIANKYVQTPHGLFDLKFFFTCGYDSTDGQSIANTSIKERIETIINLEDPTKPYSDQAIAQLLGKEGVTIARRTVAKYREELKILPTHLRRSF